MPRVSSALIILGFILAACAEFPELDAAISDSARQSGFPDLIDLSEIPVGANDDSDTQAMVAALSARANSLRARAKRLRAPIIDNRTRRRLRAAVRRHNP